LFWTRKGHHPVCSLEGLLATAAAGNMNSQRLRPIPQPERLHNTPFLTAIGGSHSFTSRLSPRRFRSANNFCLARKRRTRMLFSLIPNTAEFSRCSEPSTYASQRSDRSVGLSR